MEPEYLTIKRDIAEAERSLENAKSSLSRLEGLGRGNSDDASAYRIAIVALEKALKVLKGREAESSGYVGAPIPPRSPVADKPEAEPAKVSANLFGLGDSWEIIKKTQDEYTQHHPKK